MNFIAPIDASLSLRLLEPRHAPEVFAVIDANREHLGRWLPWVAATTSVQDVRTFASGALRDYVEGKRVTLSVLEHGRVVGGVGLDGIVRSGKGVDMASADIGYWLAVDAQGRGLMTRSVRALLDHAFGELGLLRVNIRVEPDNARSCAIPERLGFQREGTLRGVCQWGGRWVDHHLYAMLAHEWNQRR